MGANTVAKAIASEAGKRNATIEIRRMTFGYRKRVLEDDESE